MSTPTDERIQSALGHLRDNLDEDTIADLLEQMVALASPSDPRTALTDEQEAALTRAGMPSVDMPPVNDRASTLTWRAQATLMADAYSTPQVAEMLGVGQSRVRQHVSRRTLLAVKTSSGLKFPRFQFTKKGHIVPGWASVAPRFPTDAHPAAVESFLTGPNEELEIDGHPVSPLVWLTSGGDPTVVAELATDAYRTP